MYVLCMLVFPLMVTFLFTSLMDEGQPENMPVGIVDQDNTTFTRKLTHSLDAFQTTRIVARYASFEEARQAMQHGDIYAFLYFPEGTTDALLSSRRPTISFYYTYTSLTAGALLFRDLKTISTLGSAAIGQATLRAKGLTPEQIATFLQPIKVDLHTVSNPWVNYNTYLSTMLIPGCLLLFVFLITAYALGQELKMQTSKELMKMANNNIFVALFGKMLPHMVINLAVFYFLSVLRLFGHALPLPRQRCRDLAPRFLERGGIDGLCRLHVWLGSCAPHVDESLLAVGCAQLLYGGHGVPDVCHGRSSGGACAALPLAPLFPPLPDVCVQRQRPGLRLAQCGGAPGVRHLASACGAQP